MVLNFSVLMIIDQLIEFMSHGNKQLDGFGIYIKEHTTLSFIPLIIVYQLTCY